MLMSWLSNVVWLEFPTLPKDLVSNLVLKIGSSFLNLGILVPAVCSAEVNVDADSVIEGGRLYRWQHLQNTEDKPLAELGEEHVEEVAELEKKHLKELDA